MCGTAKRCPCNAPSFARKSGAGPVARSVTEGDSFFVVFVSASDAVGRHWRLSAGSASYGWPDGAAVLVRMGLHTAGSRRADENGYVGMDVHRAAPNCLGSTWRPDRRVGRNGSAHRGSPAGRAAEGPGMASARRTSPSQSDILQVVADGLQLEFPPLSSLGTLPTCRHFRLPSSAGTRSWPRLLSSSRVPGCVW